MLVQSLKLIVEAIFVLEFLKRSPPEKFTFQNSSDHENCYIEFLLKTFSNQVTIRQVSFEIDTSFMPDPFARAKK